MDNRDQDKGQRGHETGSEDDTTPTGQGSTGEGSMGGESWQDRSRDAGQEDTDTADPATSGSEQVERS